MPVSLSRLRVVAATAVAGALVATGLVATTLSASAAAGHLIINELYARGGSANQPFTHKYVEIYNPTSAPISLGGLSIQYRSATGTANASAYNLNSVDLAPGDFYVLQGGSNGSNGVPLPTDQVDQVAGGFNPGGENGTVFLASATSGINPDTAAAQVIDKLGMGSSNSSEGTAATYIGGNSNPGSLNRLNDDDTNNNASDFAFAVTPTPGAINIGQVLGDATGTPSTPPPTTVAPGEIVPIAEIQGTGSATAGGAVTTTGVVTATYPTGGFNGFYIQTPGSGGAPKTAGTDASDGIFVYTGAAPTVTIGQCVVVSGTANEYFTLTQISNPVITAATEACAPVQATELDTLPVSDAEKEVYEGMLVLPKGNYTITNNYQLNEFGQLGLAVGDEPLYTATDKVPYQQAAAYEADQVKKLITLDDGSSWNYMTNATAKGNPLPYLSQATPMRTNSQLTFTDPVILDYRFQWNFQPTGQVNGVADFIDNVNDRPLTVPNVGGSVQIANFNVLNYFTSLGQDESGCRAYNDREGNPVAANNCQVRGAYTPSAFADQEAKIVAAINGMDAEVVGLMEIENSANFGQTRDYTLSKLVDALNADDPTKGWEFVPTNPGQVPVSEDNIRLAFIYRAAEVTPIDGSLILQDPAFSNARQPLAQKFGVNDTDTEFVVITNHFKSKGSGSDDGTGQGFSNPARKAQAAALVDWADTVFANDAVFLTGDFNAYTMEEPMQIMYDAGYANVITDWQGTYQFGGRLGSLDHITANAAAQALISDAQVWEINGDEAIAMQYSRRNYNVTDFHTNDEYASSDHDPVVVGIKTGDEAVAPVVTNQPASVDADAGQTVTFTASASGDPAPTVQWQSSTDGTTWTDIAGATSQTLTVAAVTVAQDGTQYRAVFTNEAGNDTTDAASLTVTDSTPLPTYPASGVFGDHDGDGIADIYVINADGELELWKGSATAATLLGTRGTTLANVAAVSQIGDWNGDQRSDALVRPADGNLWIYTADASGALVKWKQVGKNWHGMDIITYVGSLDGSANKYVVARHAQNRQLYRYTITENGLTGLTIIGQNWHTMKFVFSVGDFTGDGLADVMGIRASDSSLWLYPGDANGRIGYARQVGRNWQGFTAAFSPGDLNKDGRFDLVGVDGQGRMFGYLNNGAGGWTFPRQLADGFADDKLFA